MSDPTASIENTRPSGHVVAPDPPRDVFLDTNVLLDHLMRRNGSEQVTSMLKACVRHDVVLRCAATSLKDIAYVTEAALRREFATVRHTGEDPSPSKEGAEGSPLEDGTMRMLIRRIPWHCVEQARALCDVAVVGRETCDAALALRTRHDDFEDDLIIAAAQHAGSRYVVTSDRRLIEHFPEICIAPTALMELLDGSR
ncbi:PIN domain [Bifidobacterium parmae]|uniref:PIN domain n=2 Tax=Bifidobacterium parmae TaxID=361854 RepID=A0A2N5IWG3_9BIFI|nr:PIN domain [Bifidobacterium parmae]